MYFLEKNIIHRSKILSSSKNNRDECLSWLESFVPPCHRRFQNYLIASVTPSNKIVPGTETSRNRMKQPLHISFHECQVEDFFESMYVERGANIATVSSHY